MSYRKNIKRISLNNDEFSIEFGSFYCYNKDTSIPIRFTERGEEKLESYGIKSPIRRVHLTNDRYMSFLMHSGIPDSKILLTSEVFEDPYEIDLTLLRNLWHKDKINTLSIVINYYPFRIFYYDESTLVTKAYLETLVVEPK